MVLRRTNKLGDLWTIQTRPENPRDSIKIVQNIKGLDKARKYAKDHHWKVIGTIPRNPEGVKESTRKFNESIKDIAPGIQDWGTTVYIEKLGAEMSWDDIFFIVKKDCRQYPLLEEELGLEPHEEPTDDQIREWIKTKPDSFIEYLEEFGTYNDNFADDDSDDSYDDYYDDSYDSYDESSRKFGKEFNESKGLEWLNSFKQAQDFVDKACEQLEVVAFEGGAEVGNPIHKKLLRIWGEMRDVIESV